MTDPAERPRNCGGCAFWHRLRDGDGICCRWAPDAATRPETTAHWPLTHELEGCGDGVAAAPFSIGAYCVNCLHWRRPERGLNPVNRGDMPMSWWARAGHCTRHAPRPSREPGPRGFWRATLDTDFCGEGAPRKSEPKS